MRQDSYLLKKLIFTGGRRDNFGLNPVEGGESEPEDITEDNRIANSTTPCTTFFPANQTATTSFQNQQNQACYVVSRPSMYSIFPVSKYVLGWPRL